MNWMQLTLDDEPVLVDFAKVTHIRPARGILGKGDKCAIHFASNDSMGGLACITVTESYDEVAQRLHELLNAPVDKPA